MSIRAGTCKALAGPLGAWSVGCGGGAGKPSPGSRRGAGKPAAKRSNDDQGGGEAERGEGERSCVHAWMTRLAWLPDRWAQRGADARRRAASTAPRSTRWPGPRPGDQVGARCPRPPAPGGGDQVARHPASVGTAPSQARGALASRPAGTPPSWHATQPRGVGGVRVRFSPHSAFAFWGETTLYGVPSFSVHLYTFCIIVWSFRLLILWGLARGSEGASKGLPRGFQAPYIYI